MDIKDYEEALAASWGSRVAARRSELCLSQTQLAERVGITQTHVSRIERGEVIPGEGLKAAIADRLRVKRVGDLFPQPRTVAPVRVREGSAA